MRRVLLGLLVLLAVALAVNTVVTDRETEEAHADVGRVLDLPGGDLQVREDGPPDGPALVLLHGFACSIGWWDQMTPALARDHRVIRFDLLGHGGSEKPKEGYGMESQARLVAAAPRPPRRAARRGRGPLDGRQRRHRACRAAPRAGRIAW